MVAPWLHIIGIGEDGMVGLSAKARRLVEEADVIIGGDRHHDLAPNITAERISWPSPFDALIDTIKSLKGRKAIVLVTGDPLWYSVGSRILKGIRAEEIVFHPQLSAFQLAACRMGWSLADVETLTVHGRAPEQIIPYIAPRNRMILLTQDASSPAAVGQILDARGYGMSPMVVLAAMGGPDEARYDGQAAGWNLNVPDFHVLCVECVAGPGAIVHPRTGLPDDAFVHDGKLTKQAVRSAALAKLSPFRGGVLWDVGAGCGSVGIEWMRAAPEALAFAVEPRPERREMIGENARRLGAPKIRIVDGVAPDALDGLPDPDAVFIGGGVSAETISACIRRLAANGRLVAHAVTLESEAVLLKAFAEHGGSLDRISSAHASPVGTFHGWRTAMPVTQWTWTRQ